MPDISPLIRLFVSSTFTDFALERDVLQRMVFPRLRQLCEAQGCRFQPIDLRWGVSEEAGNEKRTLAICFEEIRRCQQLSPDLNFLILLGDRYGSCFLPATISSTQVARLLPHLNTEEQDIFRDAYREDLNALPPEYVLLPNTAAGRNDEQLRMALGGAARAAGFSPEEVLPFVASATHLEIQRGLLAAGADPAAVVCALRSFTPTPAGNDASGYIEQDSATSAQVESLKHAVEERLGGRLQRYVVPWGVNGLVLDREALARQLLDLLEPRVREALARRQAAAQTRDPVGRTNAQFAAARASGLVGREDALATVAAYLSNQLPLPLVVTGASGVGKSSLLARAVEDATRAHPSAVIVTRYIGVTPGTSSLADLLTGLRHEIAERYGQPAPEPVTSLHQLVAAVAAQLERQWSIADRPLFLFIDALDQLGSERQRVDWLPRKLAPNVRAVVSILSGRPELANLRALLPEGRGLRLDPLTREQGAEVLRKWLAAEERRLTPILEAAVLDGFAPTPESSGTPLYLRLAFEQARRWRSFDLAKPLPPTVPALIQAYFEELEEPRRHGRELVAHALGYVAAAKHGLVEDELLDLLPRSEVIREELERLSPNSPPIVAIQPLPMALWAHLAFDLERYLTEREADGARLVTFYHRGIRDAVERFYLHGTERAARHAELAAYFGEQAYYWSQGSVRVWNRRKLAELAYQQAEAGSAASDALKATLTDGRFLEGKLTAESVAATLDALALAPDDKDIVDIDATVRAGAVVLSKAPSELLNQITGRIGPKGPLHDLPERAIPWFRLRSRSLNADTSLLHILQGHTDHVTSCALTADGQLALSASKDHTLRLWDTATGECLRILKGNTDAVSGCALSVDGSLAVSISSKYHENKLWFWDTTTGKLEHAYKYKAASAFFALNADAKTALLTYDVAKLKLMDTANGRVAQTINEQTGLRSWFLPVGTTACALSTDQSRALAGFENGMLRVWDTATGQLLHIMKGHSHSVSSCAFTSNGRLALTASNSERTLRVWDIDNGQLLPVLEGHTGGVRGCAISANGAVALSSSKDRTVRLWDVGTGKLIGMLTGHTSDVTCCALSADGRFALSGSVDKTVRVWDTNKCQVLHPAEGHADFIDMVSSCALSEDGRLALTASADRTLRLWDTASGQTLRTLKRRRDLVRGIDKLFAVLTGIRGLIRFLKREEDWLDSAPIWSMMLEEPAISFRLDDLAHLLAILGSSGYVLSCALSADGTQAISTHTDGTLRLWDTVRGRRLRKLRRRSEALNGCSLSAHGELAFDISSPGRVATGARQISLWDTSSRKRLIWTTGETEATGCALSADGSRAIASCGDGTLRLWHSTHSQDLHILTGLSAAVNGCALSEDGRLALSASSDGTLRLIDTIAMREIARWTHDSELRSCALSVDGRLAVAGDLMGNVHFLDMVGIALADEAPAGNPPVSQLAERSSRTLSL